MSLEPKIINKVKDCQNHKELLENFIGVMDHSDCLDLTLNILYEFESVRQQLMGRLTNSFLHDACEGYERQNYQAFVQLIRNINMIRMLCRDDIIKAGLTIEVDEDNNLVITKGGIKHIHDKTIFIHDGYKYTIHEGDDDLSYLIGLITDDDGSYMANVVENSTCHYCKIDKEKI